MLLHGDGVYWSEPLGAVEVAAGSQPLPWRVSHGRVLDILAPTWTRASVSPLEGPVCPTNLPDTVDVVGSNADPGLFDTWHRVTKA
jgi:hypothetical protein